MKILARSCMSADGLFSCPEIMATGEAIVLRKHFRRSGQTRYTLANASDFLDPLGAYALTQTPTYHFRRPSGAGDGSRTRLCSLGSCHSTDELHPQDSPAARHTPQPALQTPIVRIIFRFAKHTGRRTHLPRPALPSATGASGCCLRICGNWRTGIRASA